MPLLPAEQLRRLAWLGYALPLYAWALVVNSAVPGWLTSPMGIPTWSLGFSASLAHADGFSLHAHDIGLPEPAAQSFGLPGSLVSALAIKAGLSAPDGYTIGVVVWLTVSFWGACALGRHLGVERFPRILGAATWLTLPIVWQHANYAMLAIGIALLPTYLYSVLRLLGGPGRWYAGAPLFVFLAVVASFMDGYTFVMFASAGLALAVYTAWQRGISRGLVVRVAVMLFGFGASYFLYSRYMPSQEFTAPLEFFRSFGVDLGFLVSPPSNWFWLMDLLGLSTERDAKNLWGDSSVFKTTFLIVPMALAVVLAFGRYGDRRLKLVFLGIAVIAFYLALGPSLKIGTHRPSDLMPAEMPASFASGPTGSGFLWENVPGLESMRAVYRWAALGAVCCWVVILAALADSRLRKWGWTLLALVLVVSAPQVGRVIDIGDRSRDGLLTIEREFEPEGRFFARDEKVLFLPPGNDFLATWLGPLLDIRTYNIGGDKNAEVAQRQWPEELQPLRFGSPGPRYAQDALLVLAKGLADTIAVPRIPLLEGSHQWPAPALDPARERPYVDALEATGALDVTPTRFFTLFRLKSDADLDAILHPCLGDRAFGSARRLVRGIVRVMERLAPCDTGWGVSEPWGRWTTEERATLHLVLPDSPRARTVHFDARAFLGELEEQTVRVHVNGRFAEAWVFPAATDGVRAQRLTIPAHTTRLQLTFLVDDLQAAPGADPRSLGLGLSAFCLAAPGTACLPTR